VPYIKFQAYTTKAKEAGRERNQYFSYPFNRLELGMLDLLGYKPTLSWVHRLFLISISSFLASQYSRLFLRCLFHALYSTPAYISYHTYLLIKYLI